MARPQLSAVAELLKPITWFPPMWAFGCGVVASGVSSEGRWPIIVVGIVLAFRNARAVTSLLGTHG